MKLNTFYLCYAVWGVASALSIVLSIWKNHKLKRVHSIQLIYLRQFILLAQSGKTSKDINRELYYFIVADKVMRKILLDKYREKYPEKTVSQRIEELQKELAELQKGVGHVETK